MIDVKTAERTGYQIGDTVPLVSSGPVPRVEGELVGIAQFGDTGNLVGATLTFFDTPTAQRLLLGSGMDSAACR